MKSDYLNQLPDDVCQIPNSYNWVDREGNVYSIETRVIKGIKHKHYGKYFKLTLKPNKSLGYITCGIKYIDGNGNIYQKTRRVHILIAEAFIENPNNYPIVGHKNNIKIDNRVENLYWTTISENTKKAYDDGLAVNAKRYEDNQSHPVIMFDTYTNQEIARYGSIVIASKETGICMATISNQAKYKRPIRKPYYFRFQNDSSIEPPVIVIEYDMKTDQEIARYWNSQEAERKTGINQNIIRAQCKSNKKPKWSKHSTYFKYSK